MDAATDPGLQAFVPSSGGRRLATVERGIGLVNIAISFIVNPGLSLNKQAP